MVEDKYSIVGIGFNGVDIVAYRIKYCDGKEVNITVENAKSLAYQNKFDNAVICSDGTYESILIYDGIEKLNEIYIDDEYKIEITARVVDSNGVCTAYKVTDKSKKIYNITLDKVWELALNNCINRVEAVAINGVRTIISAGDSKFLNNLPEINE